MARNGNDRQTPLLRHVIRHPLADITLLYKCAGGGLVITEAAFGDKASFAGRRCRASSDPRLQSFNRRLRRVLDGKEEDLSMLPIDMSNCTEFQRRVLTAARLIPFGTTVSYRELAKRAGLPAAARAAASVMRANKFPLIIPCHRVVKSDGTIGGFMGKQTGKAVELKKRLLEGERKALLK